MRSASYRVRRIALDLIIECAVCATLVVALLAAASTNAFGAQKIDPKTYVPVNAFAYFTMLRSEIKQHAGTVTPPWYFGGLVEQESCIYLTHRRCWSPTSELKTDREQGVGFGQITRAYRSDGSLRFDTLADLRKRYPKELGTLNWDQIKQQPDLQLRAMILLFRSNYDALVRIPYPYERLAMADAAYNGGLAGVVRERQACAMTKDCDGQRWFGNVENFCLKSKAPLYGQQTACSINRTHVFNTLKIRMSKYEPYLK